VVGAQREAALAVQAARRRVRAEESMLMVLLVCERSLR
jgi:hypothetical protein